MKCQEVNIDTVKTVLEKSDLHKATGYDQIPAHILKEDAEQLAVPMAYLFNEYFHQSQFSLAHKAAEVGPQHKKNDMLKK